MYQFAAGQGLDYAVGSLFTNNYSIEMVFEFTNTNGFRRVLDYKNLPLILAFMYSIVIFTFIQFRLVQEHQ